MKKFTASKRYSNYYILNEEEDFEDTGHSKKHKNLIYNSNKVMENKIFNKRYSFNIFLETTEGRK